MRGPTLISVALGAVGVLSLVIADRVGALGVFTNLEPDIVSFKLRIVDAASSLPIEGVHAVCTRRGTRSACTQTPMSAGGELDLRIGVLVRSERTLLFERGTQVMLAEDGVVHIMLIHPDYERKTVTFAGGDIAAMSTQPAVIGLDRAAQE